ncbi:MAG: hypothetical protein RLN74_11880, partial [Ilumatobacter fluminis]
MLRYEVWAPSAATVGLEVDGRRFDLAVDEGGWWTTDEIAPEPGDRYGFSVDGSDPLPDPLSPSQPDGVHAASEWVDNTAFAWTDHDWRGVPLAGAVLYELHVGTFTPGGTFDDAIAMLPYLRGLGVDAVEV